MRTKRRFLVNSIAASIVIGVLIFLLLISFAPDTTPYSVNNYGSNGMHNVSAQYAVQELSSVTATPLSNATVLLIVAPTSTFSQASSLFVKQFVQYGGEVIIADSNGFSNSLLEGMGVGIQIGNQIVLDPSFNWKSSSYPIALVNSNFATEFPFLSNVSGIALTEPRALIINSPLVSVLATSSAQSIEVSQGQSTGNNLSSISGRHSSFPLVAAQKIGRGLLLVIGDSSIFTNSVESQANNGVFVSNLLFGLHVYLDTSHWPLNTVPSLKAQLILGYDQLSALPYRYLFALVFVGAALLLTPAFTGIFSLHERKASLAKRDPSMFNNDILNRVRRDRERYGVQHE